MAIIGRSLVIIESGTCKTGIFVIQTIRHVTIVEGNLPALCCAEAQEGRKCLLQKVRIPGKATNRAMVGGWLVVYLVGSRKCSNYGGG